MKKVTVSAPGKLHLSGEHAVVYGKPAIVVATSLRLYVTLSPGNKGELRALRLNDAYIHAIVSVFEKKHGMAVDDDLCIAIRSTIPMGAGMGSSAALSVSLIGALSLWYGHPWNASLVNDMAYQAEKTKHGNSSGSDPAVATHGGLLWYRKELEFLKTLWLLPFKIPTSFTPCILINTGRNETTGDLVRHVATVKSRDEHLFTLTISRIEETTRSVAQAIHDEDEDKFRRSLTENERLLEEIEIVSPETTAFIKDIESFGGTAKVSGAGGRSGGSGVVIAMHTKPQIVVTLAKKHNSPSFQVLLGGEGIKIEQVLA